MIIGLTGKMCSGKDLAADVFAERGWLIIDEDSVGHQALLEQSVAITDTFGDLVLDELGEVSRRKLGTLVFQSPTALKQLEAIVHPWMVETTKRLIEERTTDHAVINAAILFKMGLHELCDSVLIVRASALQRVRRCLSRDELSPKQVLKRITSQRSLNRAPKGVDTVTVWNIGSRAQFVRRIARLFP